MNVEQCYAVNAIGCTTYSLSRKTEKLTRFFISLVAAEPEGHNKLEADERRRKMRKRKVTALLMGTLIAVSAFAGCGNGDSSSGMNIVSKAESKASSATEDDNSSKVESKTSVAGNTEPGGSGAE